MLKRTTLNSLFGAATAVMLLSAAPVFSQTATNPTSERAAASSGASSDSTKSAKGSGSVSKADQKFMRDMAYSNISEIETAKLALEKTQNQEVKTFAQQMIDDHTKAMQQLQQTAQAKGVELPTEPDKKHKAAAKTLSALTGDAFDRAYMKQAGTADHKNTHKLLERASKKGTDSELKTLAEQTMPTVHQHLEMAQKIQGKSASGASGGKGASKAGTEDAAGLTPENKAGKMSPTGQNETSSAKPATGSSK